MRKRLLAVLAVAAVAAGLLWLRPPGPAPSPTTVVLAVRDLGELRLARHEFTEAGSWQTEREPAEWAASVPFARPVVAAFTRNEAVGTLRGRVDAGVDFSRARIVREGGATMVTLPEPSVLDCVVQARVLRQRDGLFWRDPDMASSAEAKAEARLREAAVRAGILDQARRQAERLAASVVQGPVSVRFEDGR